MSVLVDHNVSTGMVTLEVNDKRMTVSMGQARILAHLIHREYHAHEQRTCPYYMRERTEEEIEAHQRGLKDLPAHYLEGEDADIRLGWIPFMRAETDDRVHKADPYGENLDHWYVNFALKESYGPFDTEEDAQRYLTNREG